MNFLIKETCERINGGLISTIICDKNGKQVVSEFNTIQGENIFRAISGRHIITVTVTFNDECRWTKVDIKEIFAKDDTIELITTFDGNIDKIPLQFQEAVAAAILKKIWMNEKLDK